MSLRNLWTEFCYLLRKCFSRKVVLYEILIDFNYFVVTYASSSTPNVCVKTIQ